MPKTLKTDIEKEGNNNRKNVRKFFLTILYSLKLGPHYAWFVFVMRHASWFAHRVYEKMCLIWVDVSFVHSSNLVRQLGGKLTHQSEQYVSDSTNLFDTFTHDAPRIRTTHREDPALEIYWLIKIFFSWIQFGFRVKVKMPLTKNTSERSIYYQRPVFRGIIFHFLTVKII